MSEGEKIKDIIEILELSKEEIENNDENVSAILDLQDLKSLKNLYDLYNKEKEKNKELEKYKTYYEEMEEVNKKFIAIDKIKEKIENYIISYNDIESNFDTTAQQYNTLKELDIKIEILEELLEEKNA